MLQYLRQRIEASSSKADKSSKQIEIDPESLLKITRHDSRKERRLKLKHSFQRNSVMMKVTEEDLLMEADEDVDEMTDLYQGCLIIPRKPSSLIETNNATATVPNCCIICLDSYKAGDCVVWSSNPDCSHAFHRSCIIKYLDKKQKRVAYMPCPCCRRGFTDLQVEKRQRRSSSRQTQNFRRFVSTLFSTRS